MPTISDFWLSGGRLTLPAWSQPREPAQPSGRSRHFYAVEYGDSGPVVYRFKFAGELAIWIASAEPGVRERVVSSDPRVESAKARDEWGEHDESL